MQQAHFVWRLLGNHKFIILVLGSIVMLIFYRYSNVVILNDFKKAIYDYHNNRYSEPAKQEKLTTAIVNKIRLNSTLINTPTCTLPKTNILPATFKLEVSFKPNCSFERTIVTIDDQTQMLKILPGTISAVHQLLLNNSNNSTDRDNLTCSVIQILRSETKDSFRFGREFKVASTLNISDKELIATKCGPYINFDAHFPITPSVNAKIQHWRQARESEKDPISVLFMGFGTTSRSHFYRSFKLAIPFMIDKMEFIDFKGYHSIAPNTLENYFAFLLGLKKSTVRSTCAPSWTTPFDKCPLVWKHFNSNKFVTMYVEDGSQTFNWGSQSGFNATPTDYYPHALFKSVEPYRQKFNKKQDNGCMSTFNCQNFILDYTKRFLKKFMVTPFFAFSWFADPFHDSESALPGFDSNFTQFLQVLNSEEFAKLRENTLIIFNSDHGQRQGRFVHPSFEGFIERSLAGLFIRIPDKLQNKFPELDLKKAVETNGGRLTSGFDIRHTLLHLLDLQGMPLYNEAKPFQPVLKDRSSLFLPVSDTRTCNDIHVTKGICMCNASNEGTTITNPYFTNQLIDFAVLELNSMIKGKYKKLCSLHDKPEILALSATVLGESANRTDVDLKFTTDMDAEFEVQLRVFHGADKMKVMSIKRLGNFNRIHQYKDQSWCVGFKTDEDKYMKEICYCKESKSKGKARILKQNFKLLFQKLLNLSDSDFVHEINKF